MANYFVDANYPHWVLGYAPEGWTDADAPGGMMVRSGVPEQPVNTLFYDLGSESVEVIPPAPSDTATWDGQEWVIPEIPPPPPPPPQWDELFMEVQGTIWFQKLYAACETSPRANRAYLSAVMAWISRNFELMAIALQDAVDTLAPTPLAYTSEELDAFNELLADRHFNITVVAPEGE